MKNRKPSQQTVSVLAFFLHNPDKWQYGYSISQELGIKSGTLYPMLIRLADRGYLETSWSSGNQPGRPPRHMYRLAAAGIGWAESWIRDADSEESCLNPAFEDGS